MVHCGHLEWIGIQFCMETEFKAVSEQLSRSKQAIHKSAPDPARNQ
jgi:hypothetical protein